MPLAPKYYLNLLKGPRGGQQKQHTTTTGEEGTIQILNED